MLRTGPSTVLRTGPSTVLRTGPSGAQDRPFDGAQDRPFDGAQDRPFDGAQDRPFDGAQDRPFDGAQDRPFDGAQDRPFDGAQDRPFDKLRVSGPFDRLRVNGVGGLVADYVYDELPGGGYPVVGLEAVPVLHDVVEELDDGDAVGRLGADEPGQQVLIYHREHSEKVFRKGGRGALLARRIRA